MHLLRLNLYRITEFSFFRTAPLDDSIEEVPVFKTPPLFVDLTDAITASPNNSGKTSQCFSDTRRPQYHCELASQQNNSERQFPQQMHNVEHRSDSKEASYFLFADSWWQRSFQRRPKFVSFRSDFKSGLRNYH